MNRVQRTGLALIVPAMLALSAPLAAAADPGITLIGKGTVAGDRLDLSGLGGQICQAGAPGNCVPQAIFGGYGSDISYSGFDNVFVAAPDRGPFDGLTDIPCVDRLNFLHITTDVGASFTNITTTLLSTRLLRDEAGRQLVGSAGDFERRFDPEGIRVAPDGALYISDEYGPHILQFNRQGNLQRRIAIPDDFAIDNPSDSPTEELTGNTSGRQANRGMEGLAISPDGTTLYGITQNALLQDNALAPGTTDRQSVYTRILKVDLVTGEAAEFVYPLVAANRGQGVSEILAINDQEFLMLERDNRSVLASPPSEPRARPSFESTSQPPPTCPT